MGRRTRQCGRCLLRCSSSCRRVPPSREAEHGERRECNTAAALPRQQQRYVDVRCVADTRAHAPPDSITTIFASIRGGGGTESSTPRAEALPYHPLRPVRA
uniref:Uncharacterized protein n=1 Tax=Setaria digitata TaxID=48799 RepID=A0A915PBY6_9BILA